MINKLEILARYARREVSPEEQEAFQEWLQTLTPEEMEQLLDEYGVQVAELSEWESQPDHQLLAAIHQEIAAAEVEAPVRRLPSLYRWGWAAAVIIGLTMVGGYWLQHRKSNDSRTTMAENKLKNDIPPGKDGALLTLADGTKVLLDTLNNGIVAMQGGNSVVINNGQLAYSAAANAKKITGQQTSFNTLSTPKGRQFRLVLPDGTKVWLNAASAIRYPAEFSKAQRTVEISGEVYFEVAGNAHRPFKIIVNHKEELEVLGTAFNVNAYENEKVISTTLLEGAVRSRGILLKPGQQLRVGSEVKVSDTEDTEKVMAWKNGLFYFNGVKLEDAMRQIERWYDIEVIYEQGIPDITFWGKIPKDISLNSLLGALKKMDVHFNIQGKKLIVLP